MNERQIFLNAAVAAGLSARTRRATSLRAELWLQERQLAASAAARLCDQPDGPTASRLRRGPGRREVALAPGADGGDDCQRVPELKCLLLRKVGKANLEHFEDLRRKAVQPAAA